MTIWQLHGCIALWRGSANTQKDKDVFDTSANRQGHMRAMRIISYSEDSVPSAKSRNCFARVWPNKNKKACNNRSEILSFAKDRSSLVLVQRMPSCPRRYVINKWPYFCPAVISQHASRSMQQAACSAEQHRT